MKEKMNEKKGIAVIAAMPSEIETIRKEFPEEKTETQKYLLKKLLWQQKRWALK